MHHPDSFIDEVTEEVRRDKLFATFRKYGWIGLVAVVAIVGGASWIEYQKASDRAAAQDLGDTLVAAMAQDDAAARVAALDGAGAAGDAGAIAALLAAGESDGAEAAARYQAVAENMALPDSYRQLATIRMVVAQGADAPAATRRAALEPLAAPGQPFRPIVLEQLALIATEEGDTDTAIAHLREAIAASDATAGLRQRASQLIVALGGSLDDPS
ncbi:hypothetical protein [Actibacterium sp. XHP0104]|uniref:hypothetical protein n=1 Tax=Actibacterium sp. XHP0104 TaxID=2984335 RepID=UPI0021E72AB4|nr:hypothetical protein [Actibacterium sp. XHP0104]MCV2881540.1 hypothetical protein [Actibacterium sp. XHP0104]